MLCFNSVGYILIIQAIFNSVEQVFVFILYALCLFCMQGICSVIYDLLCRLCFYFTYYVFILYVMYLFCRICDYSVSYVVSRVTSM